jgi:hypothetical protein
VLGFDSAITVMVTVLTLTNFFLTCYTSVYGLVMLKEEICKLWT